MIGMAGRIMKVARILKMIRAVRFLNKLKQLEQKDASVCSFLIVTRDSFVVDTSFHAGTPRGGARMGHLTF